MINYPCTVFMSCRFCCRQRVLRHFLAKFNWSACSLLIVSPFRILLSLPVVTQHLLVLLFGTFRAIANSSESSNTGMTSEAISISVAPSFFQSCVSEGNKFAKIEDVQRFKVSDCEQTVFNALLRLVVARSLLL